mgnify:CR=1 FL=1
MNMPEPITVDIAVCTFRRPHIATTLASLSALQPPPRCDHAHPGGG